MRQRDPGRVVDVQVSGLGQTPTSGKSHCHLRVVVSITIKHVGIHAADLPDHALHNLLIRHLKAEHQRGQFFNFGTVDGQLAIQRGFPHLRTCADHHQSPFNQPFRLQQVIQRADPR